MTTPRGWACESVGDIVRLLQRDDDGAFGGIHGMQRLDAENDAGFLRVGQHFAQAVQNGGARVIESLAVGWAGDDDQHRRVEERGLLDGEAVVGDAFAALGAVGAENHPPRQRLETRRPSLRISAEAFVTSPSSLWRQTPMYGMPLCGTVADGLLAATTDRRSSD